MILTNNNKPNNNSASTRKYALNGLYTKLMLGLYFLFFIPTSIADDLDSGFYGGIGFTNIVAEEKGITSEDIGVTIIGGYEFSNYLSTEVSLLNLGDHKELGMKGSGVSISVITSYPIFEAVDIFAEFGGMSINLDIDETRLLASSPSDEVTLQDGSDTSLYYSFGAKYRVNNWSIIIKTASIDLDADMDMVFAQVHYHF